MINYNSLIDNKCKIEEIGDSVLLTKLPQNRPQVLIPKNIVITEDLAWGIGFYIAEGNKKSSSGIGISNSELILIEKFKDSFENIFNKNYYEWRMYFKCNKPVPDLYYKIIKDKFQTDKVNFIQSNLATKLNHDLRVNNTLLSIIFKNLLKESQEIIIQDKNLTLAFLRGYECGDGSVIQRNGFLWGIVITVKDKQMKNFIIKCFNKIYSKKPNLRRNKGVYEISLTGVHLMTELILDKHFYEYEKQFKKLINCYLKKQYPRSHIRYWKIVKNQSLPATEIAKLTNRSHWAVRDAMRIDIKLGLIKAIRKPYNQSRPSNIYSLTEKGKKLLNIIRGVQNCN